MKNLVQIGFLRAISKSFKSLNEFLFQHSKRNASTSEDVWYDNMVVSERTLGFRASRGLSRTGKNERRERPLPASDAFPIMHALAFP